MSRTFTFRAVLAALSIATLAAYACGDDATSKDASPAGGASLSTQPPSEPLLPTPTPVPNDGPAVAVSSLKAQFYPTVAEFRTLPVVEIIAGGAYKGVTIATLAAKIQASDSNIVTIRGVRADGRTVAFVRKQLSEIATTTVLILDDKGHISIASTSLPRDEWLQAVVAVGFTQ